MPNIRRVATVLHVDLLAEVVHVPGVTQSLAGTFHFQSSQNLPIFSDDLKVFMAPENKVICPYGVGITTATQAARESNVGAAFIAALRSISSSTSRFDGAGLSYKSLNTSALWA